MLIYLNSVKKISYRKLGISPSYLSKMKRGERRISDKVLLKLLDNLSVKEFVSFEWFNDGRGGIRTHDHRRVRAGFDHEFVHKVERSLDEKIVEREVELFRNYLEVLGRSPRTINDRVQYVRRFLRSGLPLNSEGVIYFVSMFKRDARIHAVKSLRLYLKLKGRRDLLEILKTPREPERITYCPTLEEVKVVADAIEDLQAKAYFVLTAESGLRPGEVFNLKIGDLDLDWRISELNSYGLDVEDRAAAPIPSSNIKRCFCSFFSSKNLIRDYLEERKVNSKTPEKIFHNRKNIRKQVYMAMRKELGKTFETYALRRFFVTEMLRRDVNPLFLDMMQGRKPKAFRIMLGHYQKLTLRDLRSEYDKANLRIAE